MSLAAIAPAPPVNRVTGLIINAAMKVHSVLGPGLLESAYQACLAHELRKRGLHVAMQVGLPVVYEGEKIELGYRMDLVVEGSVVVEVKSIEAIHPVHEAQLLSYMRLSGIPVGLLINFNVARLRDGIKRMVDGYEWDKDQNHTIGVTGEHRER
jgi:GxxExxY protein